MIYRRFTILEVAVPEVVPEVAQEDPMVRDDAGRRRT